VNGTDLLPERQPGEHNEAVVDYEFRQLVLPRGTSRNAAWRLLTEQAEHHGWELDRLRLYPDGTRRVRLRRRVLRVARTM
jgi:uncharacterized protein DUF5703